MSYRPRRTDEMREHMIDTDAFTTLNVDQDALSATALRGQDDS